MSERVHVTASTGRVDPENTLLYLRILHEIKNQPKSNMKEIYKVRKSNQANTEVHLYNQMYLITPTYSQTSVNHS